MPIRLAELASLIGGRLRGDGDTKIHGAAPLYEANSGDITFIDHENKTQLLAESSATAAVVSPNISSGERPAIEVDDVHAAFTALVLHFRPRRKTSETGIHASAVVSSTAQFGCDVTVHATAVIGDKVTIGDRVTIHSGALILAGCVIGDDVTIYPGVVLYEDTQIGSRTIIHGGAVLGANGFGYDHRGGQHIATPQLGYVRIEEDVEIGANTTIDRGTYGATVIGAGTKLDNQVQIGHNCRIGRHNLLCSQVGIAGSTTTGDYVVMGGQVGVRDHIHIGSQSTIGAMAGLINNVPDGSRMFGLPACPEGAQKRQLASLAKLPEMRRKFRKLCKQVEQLMQNAQQSTLPPEWLDEDTEENTGRDAAA